MSLVDLGKRLLEAARKGQDDEVRNLMANGAPFTTDWVSLSDTHNMLRENTQYHIVVNNQILFIASNDHENRELQGTKILLHFARMLWVFKLSVQSFPPRERLARKTTRLWSESSTVTG